MARPTRREQFQRIVRRLRKNVPASSPVRVKREKPGGKNLADCARLRAGRGALFVIRIRPQARHQEAVDSLVHEWAHAMSWSDGHPSLTDHDELWGCCVSKAYRAVYGEERAAAKS